MYRSLFFSSLSVTKSAPVPYVDWVCCWFSPWSESLSPDFSVFLPVPPQKKNIYKFQFDQDRGPA